MHIVSEPAMHQQKLDFSTTKKNQKIKNLRNLALQASIIIEYSYTEHTYGWVTALCFHPYKL